VQLAYFGSGYLTLTLFEVFVKLDANSNHYSAAEFDFAANLGQFIIHLSCMVELLVG
jgi:hypothetical protein